MSDKFDFHQGDNQDKPQEGQPPEQSRQNPFAHYQMPESMPQLSNNSPEGVPAQYGLPQVQLDAEAAQQQYQRQWAPQNFVHDGPAGPGQAPPEAPPTPQVPYAQLAATLAQEQSNGNWSQDMINTCNQIWHDTHSPQAIYQLIGRINGQFQSSGLPFMFLPKTDQPAHVPFGVPPPPPGSMTIDFVDRRNPNKHNPIVLK